MTVEDEEKDLLIDICCGNYLDKQEEPVAKAVQELQHLFTKSVCTTEWSKSNGLLLFWSKTYIPDIPDLYCHVVSLYYNLRIVGHARC